MRDTLTVRFVVIYDKFKMTWQNITYELCVYVMFKTSQKLTDFVKGVVSCKPPLCLTDKSLEAVGEALTQP
jgi:hypothetical protein